jgi:hypothetical protein
MSRGSIRGVTAAGLGVVADGDVKWATLSGGTLTATGDASGLMVGLYRVRSPRVSGLAVSALQVRTIQLSGISVAALNEIRRQRGLAIGVFNSAHELNGIQIGVLNRARNNGPGFRWMPIINMHF